MKQKRKRRYLQVICGKSENVPFVGVHIQAASGPVAEHKQILFGGIV